MPTAPSLNICTGKAFGHGNQIGHNFPMVDRKPLACTAKPGHHFVRNQQDSVLVAHGTKPLHVTIWWNQHPVRADNRFDDDRRDSLRAFEFDRISSVRANTSSVVSDPF